MNSNLSLYDSKVKTFSDLAKDLLLCSDKERVVFLSILASTERKKGSMEFSSLELSKAIEGLSAQKIPTKDVVRAVRNLERLGLLKVDREKGSGPSADFSFPFKLNDDLNLNLDVSIKQKSKNQSRKNPISSYLTLNTAQNVQVLRIIRFSRISRSAVVACDPASVFTEIKDRHNSYLFSFGSFLFSLLIKRKKWSERSKFKKSVMRQAKEIHILSEPKERIQKNKDAPQSIENIPCGIQYEDARIEKEDAQLCIEDARICAARKNAEAYLEGKEWNIIRYGMPTMFCSKGKNLIAVEVMGSSKEEISSFKFRAIRLLQSKEIECYRWIPVDDKDPDLFDSGILEPMPDRSVIAQRKREEKKCPALKHVPEMTERLVKEWAKLSGRKPGKVKATQRRRDMVRRLILAEYELWDLRNAIAGVCYSSFHKEGGYDTFDVALRSPEQLEKCIGYWERYAPIEEIVRYQKETGNVVKRRQKDVEYYFGETKVQQEQARRLEQTKKEWEEREKKKKEEEDFSKEFTNEILKELEKEGLTGPGKT